MICDKSASHGCGLPGADTRRNHESYAGMAEAEPIGSDAYQDLADDFVPLVAHHTEADPAARESSSSAYRASAAVSAVKNGSSSWAGSISKMYDVPRAEQFDLQEALNTTDHDESHENSDNVPDDLAWEDERPPENNESDCFKENLGEVIDPYADDPYRQFGKDPVYVGGYSDKGYQLIEDENSEFPDAIDCPDYDAREIEPAAVSNLAATSDVLLDNNGHDCVGVSTDFVPSEAACGRSGSQSDWPEPVRYSDLSPSPISKNLLPGAIGHFVAALSEFTETPPELATIAAFGALSCATARKIMVEAEPGYREPCHLFLCGAAESGTRKTAVVNAAVAPLGSWEQRERKRLAPEIRLALSET